MGSQANEPPSGGAHARSCGRCPLGRSPIRSGSPTRRLPPRSPSHPEIPVSQELSPYLSSESSSWVNSRLHDQGIRGSHERQAVLFARPPSPPACRDCLFPNRIHGVNPWCPSGVSVNTCSRRRAPSGIRSLPAWAFPSSQPSSRTGGRPRPSSWSLPRCAFPSCCNGGGGSRLQPFAKKQHCSTQPSTSWTQPSMSSSSEMIPRAQRLSRR